MFERAFTWVVRAVLAAVAALAVAGAGGGCARHIQVLDMGLAESDTGRPTHGRVRVDLTESASAEADAAHPMRPPLVRLFHEDVLVYQAEATGAAPVEIVDLDPGEYRLVVERVPDAPYLDVEQRFTLAEDSFVSLVYDDRRWVREFWDDVGEAALVTGKVVGIAAILGGCVALDAAIIGGCVCCRAAPSGYVPITLIVAGAMLK